MRRVVDTFIVLVTLAIGAHYFLVAGWLAPIVVDSGSMGANMPGPHRRVVCESCRLQFICDALNLPASGCAVCPNCWFTQNDLTPLPDLPGDRLFVDRAAWTFSAPRRWQTFVLANPADPKSWVVKRIVGLPGEQVEIRDGDVWIDGRRTRKDLDTLRAMAILVHDDAHRPSPRNRVAGDELAAAFGWRASGAISVWRQAEHGWTWQAHARNPQADPERKLEADPECNPEYSANGNSPADAEDSPESRADAPRVRREPFDWLAYHHGQSPAAHGGLVAPGPIEDDDAYNQSESRTLHPVRDLLVRFKATAPAELDLATRIDDGRDAFEILWRCAAGECELRRWPIAARGADKDSPSADQSAANDVLQKRSFEATAMQTGAMIELAQCDGQLLVAINGRPVIAFEYEPSLATSPPSASPVAIGWACESGGAGANNAGSATMDRATSNRATAHSATIDNLAVLRDVVYLPTADGHALQYPVCSLGPAEYFLLGDNSAHSLDSRHWPPGSASRERLVGRVMGVLAPGAKASRLRTSRE